LQQEKTAGESAGKARGCRGPVFVSVYNGRHAAAERNGKVVSKMERAMEEIRTISVRGMFLAKTSNSLESGKRERKKTRGGPPKADGKRFPRGKGCLAKDKRERLLGYEKRRRLFFISEKK